MWKFSLKNCTNHAWFHSQQVGEVVYLLGFTGHASGRATTCGLFVIILTGVRAMVEVQGEMVCFTYTKFSSRVKE